MNSQHFHSDILSFMDLLDLDEDVIDLRLKTLMMRQSHTPNHLLNIIYLLNYKKMINLHDALECDNDEELNFVAKLMGNLHPENVDFICKITNIVLSLNPTTIVAKSEHILQQIFALMDFEESETGSNVEEKYLLMLYYFKVCDSVLDAVIQNGEKLYLLFLELPVNKVLDSPNVALKMHFLINTVPRFFKGTTGYSVLDHIWNYIKLLNEENKVNGLKVLSSLSNFYLPVEEEETQIVSNIVLQYQFWDTVLFGLMSNDPYVRKIAIYLGKRAVDCVTNLKRSIHVKTGSDTVFFWDCQNEKKHISIWNNFFILMESLEEKQGNIVLPCLSFFEFLTEIGDCWLNCAYNIGLRHDNTQVKLKCIGYRCCTKISKESEALLLLEAVNDITLYDKHKDYQSLKANLLKLFDDRSFTIIFKVIPLIKWSPIPFFHLSDVLFHINLGNLLHREYSKNIKIIKQILLIPCNIVAVRKAVFINILKTLIKYINWKELMDVFPLLQLEVPDISGNNNPVQKLLKENLIVKEDEAMIFLNKMADSYTNIDIGLIYLDNNKNKINMFVDIINEKITKITEMVNRRYSDKLQCLPEIIFITNLMKKVSNMGQPIKDIINEIIFRNIKVILQYLLELLSNNVFIDLENMRLLFSHVDILLTINKNYGDAKEILLEIYIACVLVLKDSNIDLDRKVFSLFLITNLNNNEMLTTHYKHKMLNLEHCLDVVNQFEFKDLENMKNTGKLRNAFYEKSLELLNIFVQNHTEMEDYQLKDIVDYIDKVVECGGYGCLKWILKIINAVVPSIKDDFKHLNISHFIDRMWKEIHELKTNDQYLVCIEEFVKIITQDSLLKNPNYNNVILMYSMKIIDYTSMKSTPLFYLVNQLNSKNIESYSHIIYILCEILVFAPVPRKDQRIVESLVMEIIEDPKYGLTQLNVGTHFNYQIQYLSISTLCKITQPETLVAIEKMIMKKVDDTFRNKQRYCGNSTLHRVLLSALQHILFIALLRQKNIEEETFEWCVQLLGKLPHQPSVKICLEWYISLYIYMNGLQLKEVLKNDQLEKVPLTSQFVIMYWVTKHRILNGVNDDEDFNFVMDTLLAHSMGPVFNTRLNAQYLASKLYKINEHNANKYTYTMEIIDKTFVEGATDKKFLKLKDEYFVNDFDFVSHLIPSFIYYFILKYFNINETNGNDVRNIIVNIKNSIKDNSDFKKEWLKCYMSDEEVFRLKVRNEENDNATECLDAAGTIQKKYIPWRNMTDVDAYGVGKKKESPSDLIVVASLIDKLPNLGGMARTSEVFGVKTYVVDSLRHLQDNQFQGLSVSAERWVDIEEVRPGQRLREYLLRKKTEGYSIVAAEQTSTSCPLQTFRFPKKTVLLLGHEKEGVPCDLLPIMDHCVEIPQQGFIRSLNVHVTAAIFIWEYSRQNIL